MKNKHQKERRDSFSQYIYLLETKAHKSTEYLLEWFWQEPFKTASFFFVTSSFKYSGFSK